MKIMDNERMVLKTFGDGLNAVVIGSTGGIGRALATELRACSAVSKIISFSRSVQLDDVGSNQALQIDLENELSITSAAQSIKTLLGELDIVFVATGVLHEGSEIHPEKTWRSLTSISLETLFKINTVGPALVAKHFLPLLKKNRKTVFGILSARVGSINDNHLGGWYSYRASKAALNMMIKTLSIELRRRNSKAICVGLHPGTVDTPLSKPFQNNVPLEKLFTPEQSAKHLLTVVDKLQEADSGHIFAWDGNRIPC